MNEHLADGRELSKWREFENAFKRFTVSYYRTIATAQNATAAYQVAAKHAIAIPWNKGSELRLIEAKKFFLRTQELIRAVEDHQLGIAIANDDIDIIKPPIEGAPLSGWFIPVLIAAGVIMLAGAIATTIAQTKNLEDCEAAFKGVTKFADQRFCADQSSAVCKDWTQTKARDQYKSNETIIDRLSREITQTGSKISSGLAIGLVIAIPLILFSWLGRHSK